MVDNISVCMEAKKQRGERCTFRSGKGRESVLFRTMPPADLADDARGMERRNRFQIPPSVSPANTIFFYK